MLYFYVALVNIFVAHERFVGRHGRNELGKSVAEATKGIGGKQNEEIVCGVGGAFDSGGVFCPGKCF